MTSQTNSMRACLFCIVNIHTADCYFCHLHAFLNKQKSHHYLHHGPSVRYSSILKTKKKNRKETPARRPHLQVRLFLDNFL